MLPPPVNEQKRPAPPSPAPETKPVAPETASVEAPPAQPTLTIRGTILDPGNNPAAGIEVLGQHFSKDQPLVFSDCQGRFEFSLIRSRAHQYPFQARSPDGQLQGQKRISRDDIKHEATSIEITIPLAPSRRVRVTVTDQASQPLPDAWVGIVGREAADSKTNGYIGGRSDSQGIAEIQIPSVWAIGTVLSLANGHGLDFRHFDFRPADSNTDNSTPLRDLTNVPLQLTGAPPLRFVSPIGRVLRSTGPQWHPLN